MQKDDLNARRSTADKLRENGLDRKAAQEKAIENLKDYVLALNGVASTPNGQYLLKTFIKALGVFVVRPGNDGAALIGDKALRDFYLVMIRPHLDPSLRQTIES